MLVECVFELLSEGLSFFELNHLVLSHVASKMGVECGPGAYTGEWLVPEVSFAWQRCATSHAEPRWTLVL
jgi:hypothetical protein